MVTYNLYIGSNNRTHKVDYNDLERILDKYHQGYTVNKAVQGVWLGKHEQSCIVTVANDENSIMQSVRELKRVLKQDAIGIQLVPSLEFV